MDLFNHFITGNYVYFMKIGDNAYKVDTSIKSDCIYCIISTERIYINLVLLTYIRNKLKSKFEKINEQNDVKCHELSKILYFNSLMSEILNNQKNTKSLNLSKL